MISLKEAIEEEKKIAENFYEVAALYYSKNSEWHVKQEK